MFGVDARALVARRSPAGADADVVVHLPDGVHAVDRCRRSADRYFAGATSVAEELALLEEDLGRLAGTCAREPVWVTQEQLVAHHAWAFAALERRLPSSQLRTLYLLAGITSGMLAKANHDMGRRAEALAHARAVLSCAEFGGCPALRAWGYGLHSLVLYWTGDARGAVRYAELGLATEERVRGSAGVWLVALAARAHALAGEATAAQSCLDLLRERRARSSPDWLDGIGGIASFPPARELYYAAETAVLLEHGATEQRALDAVRAYDELGPMEWSFSDDAGARSVLALARLHGRDIAGARDAIAPVLRLPPAQRVNGLLVSCERMIDRLGSLGPRSAAADDLDQDLSWFVDGSDFQPSVRGARPPARSAPR